MDTVSKEKRSQIMSKIRSKNTTPELIVRKLLHSMGYRFRLHRKDLPGKPDIVLPKFKTVIFVHGCFWHRHQGCHKSYVPKSNVTYWSMKFEETMRRDNKNVDNLVLLGWNVFIIWECQTYCNDDLKFKLKEILNNAAIKI